LPRANLTKRMKIATALIIFGAVITGLWIYIRQTETREHVVIIPAGAFIPPKDWKPDQLIFNNKYYIPSNLTIKTGDTVKWINKDSVTHTVTSVDVPKVFDEVLNPNEQFVMRFNREGVYVYYCVIHPWQGGEIKVIR